MHCDFLNDKSDSKDETVSGSYTHDCMLTLREKANVWSKYDIYVHNSVYVVQAKGVNLGAFSLQQRIILQMGHLP